MPPSFGQGTSDVFFHATKGWANHQEKYACKALRVWNCGLHPLIHTPGSRMGKSAN